MKLFSFAAVCAATAAAAHGAVDADASDPPTPRRLDSLSVDETVALLQAWGLRPYFGNAFRKLSVDGEMLQELDSDDILGPDSSRSFPDAHTMHKKKLLRKVGQLATEEPGSKLVDPSLLEQAVDPVEDAVSEDKAFGNSPAQERRRLATSVLEDDGECGMINASDFSGLHVKQACAAVSLGSAHDVRVFRNASGVGIISADEELHLRAPMVYAGSPPSLIATERMLDALNATLVMHVQQELDDVENTFNTHLALVQTELETLGDTTSDLESNVALLFEELYTAVEVLNNHSAMLNSVAIYLDPCASSPCRNGGTCEPTGSIGGFTCACPTFWEGTTCESYAASSCQHLHEMGYSVDGVYDVQACRDGVNHSVYCQFTDDYGWTLLGSFVNTDSSVSWSRPTGYDAWVDNSTFGDVNDPTSADYKSEAYFCMPISDIMLSDDYGWVSFAGAIYDSSGDRITMKQKMSPYSSCQTAPEVYPGSSTVDSSETNFKNYAMLAFHAGDPNSADRCAFNGVSVHSDATILAVSGAGCGSMGAGQWGTNYNSGADWHLRIDDSVTCEACDACNEWNGVAAVTSTEHNNNAGVHDDSEWGLLWGK